MTNALGEHPAYKLVPGVNAFPYQHPDSPVGRRAGSGIYLYRLETPEGAQIRKLALVR